ncbi:MAG TPA: hypothetical protein VG936_04340 [Lacunisphaera sp.]|nr:hypothetical protein [Lacunisphaera sp.]
MGISPMMCSATGLWLWGDFTFEKPAEIVAASFLSAIFLGIVLLCYRFGFRRRWLQKELLRGAYVTDSRLFFGLWFSLGMAILVFWGLGIEGTFFRTSFDGFLSAGPVTTFVQTFIRPMPLFIGVPMFWILLADRFGIGSPRVWLAGMSVSVGLLINFPLSVARFYALMVVNIFFYFIMFSPKLIRASWIGGSLLLVGFMSSFIIDAARFAKTAAEMSSRVTNAAESLNASSFYVGHVDAFELLVYGIEYVEDYGYTDGRQLTGALFFWVPRSVWNDKPIPTGAYLGSSYINIMSATKNTNLSAPIVLEGYLDGGWFAALVLAGMLGVSLGIGDNALLARRAEVANLGKTRICRIDCLAAPLLGLVLFFLRGPLLSTFAFTTSISLAGLFVWEVFFKEYRGVGKNGRNNYAFSRKSL